MKGRLNLFQASMLRWRAFYPYNAVHVIRIAAAFSLPRLQQAIADVIAGFGLHGLALDAARRRFEYQGGTPRITLDVVPPDSDPEEAVRREIERQLNAPFPRDGGLDPFRFFAVDRGPDFDFGLAYDHFIAAGDSIVVLLKAIAERYSGAPTVVPAAANPPNLYPPTYGRLFLRQLAPLLVGFRRLPFLVRTFRHAFRPRYPHGSDPAMAFMHFRIDRPGLAALRRTARAWGVTLNDLLIAMVLQALSPMAEDRRTRARRNELAIASIVNVRGDCGPAARGAFGQFLSSFLVSHPVPPGASLEALARDVRADTARVKDERLYLHTLIAMGVSGFLWRFLTPDRRARFPGKAYPVWAGTTSLNVDALWEKAPGVTPPPEYVRAVPTGPLAPLVVAVTTAAGKIDLGLSFRTAAFTRGEMDKMAASILRCVEELPR